MRDVSDIERAGTISDNTHLESVERALDQRAQLADDAPLHLLDPIEAAVSVSKTFWDLRDDFTALPAAQQERAAAYLGQLGDSFSALIRQLESDNLSSENLGTIEALAGDLPTVFRDAFGDDLASVLQQRLRSVPQPERLEGEMERAAKEGEAGRQFELERLAEAARICTTLSQMLRGAR